MKNISYHSIFDQTAERWELKVPTVGDREVILSILRAECSLNVQQRIAAIPDEFLQRMEKSMSVQFVESFRK